MKTFPFIFTSPVDSNGAAIHFLIRFRRNKGEYTVIDSSHGVSNWQYENTSDNWVNLPSTGLPAAQQGKRVKYVHTLHL